MRIPWLTTMFLYAALGVGVARAAEAGGLTILRAPDRAPRYGLWELDFRYPGVARFDPRRTRLDAYVTAPSGRKVVVPAHWTRAYRLLSLEVVESNDQGDPVRRVIEAPRPKDEDGGHWRVRFAPVEPGLHRVALKLVPVDPPAAPRTLWQGTFRTGPARGPGFLHRSDQDHHCLRFTDGSGYFALGLNVCWPPPRTGAAGYIEYLDKLARRAGANYTRLWLCTWGFRLETADPYAYDLAAAAQLDAVFQAARARGVYVLLCLENAHDFVNAWDKLPYGAAEGPGVGRPEFFTDRDAQDLFRAKLRYLVARYGAYTSLLGWELWNEINYSLQNEPVSDRDTRENLYLPWTRRMAAHLQAADPYDHPVTTSLGNHVVWDPFWALPHLDMVQQHSYIDPYAFLGGEAGTDAAGFVLSARPDLHAHGKPVLMAEFGYAGTNEHNPLNDSDTEGIALHNALWAGALSGYAGTPMLWWWDTYVEPNDLYFHYAALAEFLKDVDWTRPKSTLLAEDDPQVRVVGLVDRAWAGLWIQDKRATWYGQLEAGYEPERLEDVRLHLQAFAHGVYRVEWFDTRRGAVMHSESVHVDREELTLAVPAFTRDIAARFSLQKPVPDVTRDDSSAPNRP